MSRRVADALAYHDLCERAAELGIPVGLDDPRAPKTVGELAAAIRAREPAARLSRTRGGRRAVPA
jgi:hypothetical protein